MQFTETTYLTIEDAVRILAGLTSSWRGDAFPDILAAIQGSRLETHHVQILPVSPRSDDAMAAYRVTVTRRGADGQTLVNSEEIVSADYFRRRPPQETQTLIPFESFERYCRSQGQLATTALI